MLSFATEFPVENITKSDFIDTIIYWVTQSPHSRFFEEDFQGIPQEGEWTSPTRDGRKLEVLATRNQSSNLVAVRDLINRTEEWTTEVVLLSTENHTRVSVRSSRQTTAPSKTPPEAKKPRIVQQLLDRLGGGIDGDFRVMQAAHWLSDRQLQTVARTITRGTAGALPIVYVSFGFDGKYAFDPDKMAYDLSGMAHVLVEPNRRFSRLLAMQTDSSNAYGGAIGLYWPDGHGRRLFLGPSIPTVDDLQRIVREEIRESLLHRRPHWEATWQAVQSVHSRNAITQLKEAGSKDLDEYVRNFDIQLVQKQAELDTARSEIDRLRNALHNRSETPRGVSEIILGTGSEQDFYPDEIHSIVVDILRKCIGNCVPDSRRLHVLTAIAGANSSTDRPEELRDELKKILRDYTSMNASVRSALEAMGFELSAEGKHWKLRYQEDDRYTFALPVSGSDRRGGLNAASDIGKRAF